MDECFHADFLEEIVDYIPTKYAHMLFDGNVDKDKMAAIHEFVKYVVEEAKKELHVKRNIDGKSFYERRQKYRTQKSAV